MSAEIRMVEGVAYRPYLVRWREGGVRRQLTLWSPGRPWLWEEVDRALNDRGVPRETNVAVKLR